VVSAIKRQVTVQPGGIIEVRSPELPAGAQAEVIILLTAQPPVAPPTPDDGWRRHAGAFDSGDPHGSDNDRIDADLAREYGDDHELTAGTELRRLP